MYIELPSVISLLIVALYQNRTDFLNNPCTFIHKIYFSVATKSKVPGDLAVYTGFVVAVCVFTCVLLVIVFVLYYKKQQLHCAVHTSVIPGKNNRFFYLIFFLIASLNSASVEPVLVTFLIFSVYWLSLNKQNKTGHVFKLRHSKCSKCISDILSQQILYCCYIKHLSIYWYRSKVIGWRKKMWITLSAKIAKQCAYNNLKQLHSQ